MSEAKMNFFTSIYKSVSDFHSYKQFVRNSVGKAITYLLLFSLLLGLISLIRPVYDFNQGISLLVDNFEENIPEFSFENGLLEVSGEMPIIMGDYNSVVIIDTTGNTGDAILDDYRHGILLLNDRMVQKEASGKTVTDYSPFQGLSVTKEDVRGWIPLLKWVSVLIIIFGLIGFIIGKFVSALIMSLIGLIINAITKAGLTYGNIFKLSAYSLTLPIFLKVLLGFIPVTLGWFWLIYYGLSAFYMWYAMTLIRKDEVQIAENEV